jgi:SAM-dependent methyltransferase
MMCGPGYLLGKISEKRGDITLTGVDIKKEYIEYGNKKYPTVSFKQGDVLNWFRREGFDVVVCTGSVHHVSYDDQEIAIARITDLVKPGGLAIISDVYVDNYSSEMERKLAASKLGYEYLVATIKNGAPDDVVGWTADILWNDVLMHEFKMSYEQRIHILEAYFPSVETLKIWPDANLGGYGDYIHICRV